MKYVKIDKEQCKVWVDLFRNTQNEVVEVYDKDLEEDIGWRSESEDEDEPAFVGKRKKV
jgi:predicted SnoaL-like aldol condensation-catalyzing enzyme